MHPLKPSILLLSAYDAASHRYWRTWLTESFNEFNWVTLPLPDRHFYWRVRSNALTYLCDHQQVLIRDFDLIVATSMVDLVTLRGLLPRLARCPTVVYFHENQFAYPVSADNPHKSNIINAQLTSVFTALAADTVLFNSVYNRQTYFQGVAELFRRMPDRINPDILRCTQDRSTVLPVPIVKCSCSTPGKQRSSPVSIVWNHRWEYDKQPEVFFNCMYKLADEGLAFKLHVLGQSFRNVPRCFAEARSRLGAYIETWGYQPNDDYYRILNGSDIVVSTALHDFQGLSMLEAIHRHCVPVAPDRVVYPEYIPQHLLYDPADEVESLAATLRDIISTGLPQVPDVNCYTECCLKDSYQQILLQAMR